MSHPVDDRMSDRLLGHGDGLIVAFPIQDVPAIQVDEASVPTVRAFFFKVTKLQEFNYSYTQLGSISNGGSLDYNYLGDTGHGSGDDILRLENNDLQVYHIGVGLNSPYLRVYEDIDPANPNRATDYSNQSEPDPTAGDNFGFYDGKSQDDKFDPPVHTERLAFRNQKAGEFLNFGFYAENQVPDGNTDLEVVGRSYVLKPVADPEEQLFMLRQRQLRRAGVTPSMKTIMIQIGGLFPYEIGSSLPSEWNNLQEDIALDLNYTENERQPAPDVPDQPVTGQMRGRRGGGRR